MIRKFVKKNEKPLYNSIKVFLILLIILVDLVYPVTISYDSGHYLWLASIVKSKDWENWDPVRYLCFPLLLFLTQTFFGSNANSFLLLITISHLLSYIFLTKIAESALDSKREKSSILIKCIICFVIIFDPTIFGYYHALLTEFIISLIGILSCYVAIQLYKAPDFSKKFYLCAIYFIIVILITWHIKQLYFGAAFFPLIISIILKNIKNPSKKIRLFGLIIVIIIAIVIVTSTLVWNSFLESHGNALTEARQLQTYAADSFEHKIDLLKNSFLEFSKTLVKQYLVNTNFLLYYDSQDNVLHPYVTFGIDDHLIASRRFSLLTGFENRIISQRIYNNYGGTNILGADVFEEYIKNYQTFSFPPKWINNQFLLRVIPSNFLFTTSYLILPLFIIFMIVMWFKEKSVFNTSILILSGSSLLNIVIHLAYYPIDRYLFWSYSLNLLVLILIILKKVNLK